MRVFHSIVSFLRRTMPNCESSSCTAASAIDISMGLTRTIVSLEFVSFGDNSERCKDSVWLLGAAELNKRSFSAGVTACDERVWGKSIDSLIDAKVDNWGGPFHAN